MKNETKLNQRNKRNAGQHESKRIHFEFTCPTAESVAIAGTFNEWQPNATPMIALGQGRWAKDLALPPGDYEYCLVVDGQWKPDPQATETIPNPFGGVNSVRKVGNGGWCAQTARITGERAQNSASPAADEIRLRLEDNHHQ